MPQTAKKKSLPVFWIVLLSSIIVLSVLIMIPPERDPVDAQQLPWNAQFNQQGQLNALGLTIDKSTLADAMALYGKDVEVKLFSNKDETDKSLEAYFPVIYIGSIKAALALGIHASQEELNQAYTNGKKTTVTKTGQREVELYNRDIQTFMQHAIASVTLVPRKHLTERAILTRFGEPAKKEVQSDGLPHWFYPELGLEMIIDQEGPEALQYTQ